MVQMIMHNEIDPKLLFWNSLTIHRVFSSPKLLTQVVQEGDELLLGNVQDTVSELLVVKPRIMLMYKQANQIL